MLGKIEGRKRRGKRGWDGWMASPTQWIWVWANFRRQWKTGKPGMLQSMGLQRVRHDLVTEKQQPRELKRLGGRTWWKLYLKSSHASLQITFRMTLWLWILLSSGNSRTLNICPGHTTNVLWIRIQARFDPMLIFTILYCFFLQLCSVCPIIKF